MNWVPLGFGALMGLAILLGWQGFRVIRDKNRDHRDRRRAMWKLNGGIALAAIAMIAMTWVSRGS